MTSSRPADPKSIRTSASRLGLAAPPRRALRCQLSRALSNPVLVGVGMPSGPASLSGTLDRPCLLSLTQQRQHLTGVRVRELGKCRCGEPRVVGDELEEPAGRDDLSCLELRWGAAPAPSWLGRGALRAVGDCFAVAQSSASSFELALRRGSGEPRGGGTSKQLPADTTSPRKGGECPALSDIPGAVAERVFCRRPTVSGFSPVAARLVSLPLSMESSTLTRSEA